MKKILTILTLLLLFPASVEAHSGRTDAYGGHNCYTGSCAGTYHYHNGGYSSGGSGYTAPVIRPYNPTSGNSTYDISSENWCNYDVHMSWNEGLLATGYSVGISKSAGADPGPLSDTTSTSYTFPNIAPGTWYINVKSISSSGVSASQVVYWTVELPKTQPTFSVYLSGNRLTYDFTCLSKVEGPDFLIKAVDGKKPTGGVTVTPATSQTILVKGWDAAGKEYEKTITYTPPTATPVPQPSNSSSTSDDTDGFVGGLVGLSIPVGLLLLRDWWRKKKK